MATTDEYRVMEMVAEKLFRAGVFSAEVKSVDTAFAIILAGDELGFRPMASARALSLVKGKVSLSADALIGIAKRSPACEHWHVVASTDTLCTITTTRRHEEPTTLTYTLAMAARAGLTSSQTWRAHPEAMLRARCGAALARLVYPDVCGGLYEPDEAEEIQGHDAPRLAPPPAPHQLAAAPDPLAAYRARLSVTSTVDELVAVVLALAPTVAAARDAAWAAAQARAAELGEQDLGACVQGAAALTKEPAAWTVVSLFLADLAMTGTVDDVQTMTRRHAPSAAALPPAVKEVLYRCRKARLAALSPAKRLAVENRGQCSADEVDARDALAPTAPQLPPIDAITAYRADLADVRDLAALTACWRVHQQALHDAGRAEVAVVLATEHLAAAGYALSAAEMHAALGGTLDATLSRALDGLAGVARHADDEDGTLVVADVVRVLRAAGATEHRAARTASVRALNALGVSGARPLLVAALAPPLTAGALAALGIERAP